MMSHELLCALLNLAGCGLLGAARARVKESKAAFQ